MNETQLVEEYRQRLLYFVLRQVRDRGVAEEITQEVLLVAIEALRNGRVRDEAKISSYIFSTARNLVFKNYRNRSREADLPDESAESVPWLSHPEAEFLLEEQRRHVRRALDELSEDDRQILRYSFEEAADLEEAARKLGIPYAAARKRKSRAIERLRKIFNGLSQKGRS